MENHSSPSSSSSIDLHVMFLPYLSPGHMIPLVDLAKLIASCRVPGVAIRATVVTTAANVPLIQPTLDRFLRSHPDQTPIKLLTLTIDSTQENVTALPTPLPTPEFIAATNGFRGPFELLVRDHKADCIIADGFYPWTNDVASKFGIPRIIFHGSGFFPSVVTGLIRHFKVCETVADDFELFTVPNLPHTIKMTRAQIDPTVSCSSEETGQSNYWTQFVDQMAAALFGCYGNVMNSFYELEPEYVDIMKGFVPSKVWTVGPLSLCNQENEVRGGAGGGDDNNCLNWLETKKPKSVVYICFGSLGQFTCAQLREMAAGLESSGHPFVWAVKSGGEEAEWLPEGFEERVDGLIVRGWVPQVAVLNHPAIGGFVTHCGWNSFLEGASAGVPMITWPLFAEQFFNEKLIVDVVRTGVAVGSKVNSNFKEERSLVTRGELKKAVEEVLRTGEEAEERRRRAEKLAETARAAVAEGGSSHRQVRCLIQGLVDTKLSKGRNCISVRG